MIRLTTIQRRKIKEHYLTHWLYSHIAAPAKEMECQLGILRISPEELFLECVTQLDSFLDHPAPYGEVVAPSLWNDYFCQLREESPVQTTTEELELGATELTYVTNYLLCALTDRMMATQAMLKLTQSLMAHADAFAAVEACFQPKLWTSHANQCVAMLGQYAEGQERLSTTLLRLLEMPCPEDSTKKLIYKKSHWLAVMRAMQFLEVVSSNYGARQEFVDYLHKLLPDNNLGIMAANLKAIESESPFNKMLPDWYGRLYSTRAKYYWRISITFLECFSR